MSINTTPNLHLPQWTSDEKPQWLTEMNGAFSRIDMGYAENKTANESTNSEMEQVKSKALALETRVSANEQGIVGLGNSIDRLTTNINNLLILRNVSLTLTPSNGTLSSTAVTLTYNATTANAFYNTTIDEQNKGTITGTISGVPEGMGGTITLMSNAGFQQTGQIPVYAVLITLNLSEKTFSIPFPNIPNFTIPLGMAAKGSAPVSISNIMTRAMNMDDVEIVYIDPTTLTT